MKRRPRGFTLAEVMLWIALCAVLMSLSSVIIVYMHDAWRKGGAAIEEASALLAGLDRLGRDARAADERLDAAGTYRGGPACLILRVPGEGTVVYRVESGVLLREVIAGARRETTPVGRVTGFRFSPADRGTGRFVEAVVGGRRGESRYRFYLMSGGTP
jgi:type II secretory pathway component PulJ